MLTQIYLKNFVIIDELELEFDKGMLVITGETGAGKSILLDALALLLGARAESHIIREGAERTEISAYFDIEKNLAALQWLTDHDLNQGLSVILRRSLSKDGRSKSYINDHPVTLQSLSELGDLLIHIHGQNAHQNLIKRDYQRSLLDAYAGTETLVDKIKTLAQAYKQAQEMLEQFQARIQNASQRRDYLQFQLDELEQLGLKSDELPELEAKQKQLANADQLIQNCNLAVTLIDEQDNNILAMLNQALNILHPIQDHHTNIKNSYVMLENAQIQIQEALNEMHQFSNHFHLDPDTLQHIEKRLSSIYDLARKHRIKPQELSQLHEQLTKEFRQIENADEHLDEMQQNLKKLEDEYLSYASKLSQARKKAAQQLEKQITQKMHELGIQGGKLSIALHLYENKKILPTGLEQIEFLVSANPGMPLQNLSKVASGGEISRISLAIQVITAAKMITPTLIFDEVDVGIGGTTAVIVGKLLRQLSQSAQVICVTHLAQVAACGDQHWHVEKNIEKNKTTTSIKALSSVEKIQEIARMIGGANISQQSLAHAQEMLEALAD